MNIKVILYFTIFSLFIFTATTGTSAHVHYRFNQLGYKSRSVIDVLIMSSQELTNKKISLLSKNKSVIKTYKITPKGMWGDKFLYQVKMHKLKKGKYFLSGENINTSPELKVGIQNYKNIILKTKDFFKVQRCGSNENLHHKSCHNKKVVTKNTTKIPRT